MAHMTRNPALAAFADHLRELARSARPTLRSAADTSIVLTQRSDEREDRS